MPRVTISEPGKTPQPYRFKLERATIDIGRGSDNDIIIECSSCSTHHCVMQRVQGGYILKDAGSTNFIKQDDLLMEIIDLYDGMEVFVGDVPLTFNLSNEELQSLSEEEFEPHQRKKLPPVHEGVEEENEHRPSTSSPRASQVHRTLNEQKKVTQAPNTWVILLILILAICAGMTLRHYKETGDFLPTKLMEAQ
jgi:predicted component of type VI protein secretion system